MDVACRAFDNLARQASVGGKIESEAHIAHQGIADHLRAFKQSRRVKERAHASTHGMRESHHGDKQHEQREGRNDYSTDRMVEENEIFSGEGLRGLGHRRAKSAGHFC